MSIWKRLRDRLFAPPVHTASAPPSTSMRAAAGGNVFDPALKHLRSAVLPGDPQWASPDAARHWFALRRAATDHVLRALAESARGEQLVLRGSRLLKAWMGDAAREPRDLDFLVQPPDLAPDAIDGLALVREIADAVLARPAPAGVLFGAIPQFESIWTYERAEGRRVTFSWTSAHVPVGAVQVDLVFRAPMPEADVRVAVPLADGGCAVVRAATPAQALAWKLAWLANDWYPQGKDLYDAVLLAERFPLSRELLEETFRAEDAGPVPSAPSELLQRRVDWANFRLEYPALAVNETEWGARLASALAPTFGRGAVPMRAPAERPAWLTPTVEQLARAARDTATYDVLPILADALEEAGCERAELLAHCRACGPHRHGCWALDFLLNRE
jgi:Nucleotidyl transferase AbiEii toxin, Type IV TA system